jgi:hypothetical protein
MLEYGEENDALLLSTQFAEHRNRLDGVKAPALLGA